MTSEVRTSHLYVETLQKKNLPTIRVSDLYIEIVAPARVRPFRFPYPRPYREGRLHPAEMQENWFELEERMMFLRSQIGGPRYRAIGPFQWEDEEHERRHLIRNFQEVENILPRYDKKNRKFRIPYPIPYKAGSLHESYLRRNLHEIENFLGGVVF